MLDLQPIKSRLAAATPGPWRFTKIRPQPNPDADLIANAPQDLAALVAEVERLRDGIKKYCDVTENALEMWEHEDSYATLKALIENEI